MMQQIIFLFAILVACNSDEANQFKIQSKNTNKYITAENSKCIHKYSPLLISNKGRHLFEM